MNRLLFALAAAVAASATGAAEIPPDVRHRQEVRAALADPARRDAAIEAGPYAMRRRLRMAMAEPSATSAILVRIGFVV